ncbi:vacuolar protein sorting/targeting protein PEP1 [Aspergillus fumigatus]|uniref:Vacuolar protein sorting/targeting protein 10 n=3 Tax=Aspergillus fumigatus TaxID=746128 RepID=VPS10_ASPFU|nr:vacuolar protein sorting protein, putative [Aspergillus fumigatus Af293]B0YA89.1 RecName: Full=Vacuolar protein sorting/targeting protein 10; AltName: Full=Carboxypeptidase Y receptor; Short=CPY receptor; AltName: Full=Sortilin vps10; AltName: Full=Vacuolar carboxypeptidase sorting receptor vps10; Flags: Precursor [Aspergillus fumigatus A1163]Q4WBM1.1 RecName: Full=Vacuolar protein sorting/targeting protein 10; AltName: Full=Carboxypeptidase Y receptor; Short=CPY receptor; AltName: Full=Sortil
MITRWLLITSFLALAILSLSSAAKKSEPEITSSSFDNEPFSLSYFEDTETILMNTRDGNLFRSFDGGKAWEQVDGPDGKMKKAVRSIWQHPFDKNKAYALGANRRHWVTKDQAKTWESFEVDGYAAAQHEPLIFHGWDSAKVIFQSDECMGRLCIVKSYYTTDDFKTVSPLRVSAGGCLWAVGHPQFADGLNLEDELRDRVLCIVPGLKVPSAHANRLVYSDDFFRSDAEGTELNIQHGRPVSGILSAAAVKKFFVTAAKSQGTNELALYVTLDTKAWHRADFGGHRVEQDGYTLLESTNYSMQVDVLTSPSSNTGVLFTSNSNGTYFTRNVEHTNRDRFGHVDFEKIADIQGIVLVNTVKNWDKVESENEKKVVSSISFDDGRTFQSLKVGDKQLHLHSVTTFANTGRVFSSPAPGLVMGVGNTGDHLKKYSEGSLYVSDDAGVTWRHALDGPFKYEFGDQGSVIMAVSDKGTTDEIQFSIDHGKEWHSTKLQHKINPKLLTTTPDSTSLTFLLVGSEESSGTKHVVYSIDFHGLHERKCEKDDFEKWAARLNENGEPDCLMGHQQFFNRRKANADCFVDEEFKDPQPIFEPCKCSFEDFECDFNFVRSEDGKSCVPTAPLVPPVGRCQKQTDTFMGPSGWRLIPGNTCTREGGENLDKVVERPCKDVVSAPSHDKPMAQKQVFNDARQFSEQYYYLERQASSSGDDETVIMLTSEGEFWVSHDHGKNWEQPLKGVKIAAIVPHPYYSDGAFLLTRDKQAFWTVDRAYTFKSFEAPIPPNQEGLPVLSFHPHYKDWLIWTGAVDCSHGDCHSDAYFSKNRGENWDLLLRYVGKCEFESRENRPGSEKLIFCQQYENENKKNHLQLLSSENLFSDSHVHFNDAIRYATMSEYIIVASRDPDNPDSLIASVSVDGKTFARAEFPSNVDVPVKTAFTVLDSSTHAVFLHVTVSDVKGAEYGSIIKSNSNGTSYVLSLNAASRNEWGYVDFEKMQGLEGVAVVNIISNVDAVQKKGPAAKKLKTMITHNDGGQWMLLPPPAKDADGKNFGCSVKDGKGSDQCSLHLHGYTERRDPRDTFSSGSAIGLMMGIGNVGAYLSGKDEADTFMTRDGGITWKSVKKGRYMWEYGDAGSVIVIVPELRPTKVLYYSLDEGDNWEPYEFSEVEMHIYRLSTVPSDTSKNFLLWGKEMESNRLATINVDFSGLRKKSCILVEDGQESDDYYLWEPKHPFQEDNCLFGHVEQYHRKKPSSQCWNNWREPHVHSIGRNCTCTRADYECNYNYEPQNDGSCALVPGLPKPDALAVCREDPDRVEYWEPTAYRRIPQTTCSGGLILDHVVSKPCPSKEKEYEKKHGISGTGLFFAIMIPLVAAAGVGYYVYARWDGKFGQIRLGENAGTYEGLLSRESPIVTAPIAIIAGIVAVIRALPLLAMSLWRSASGYVRLGRNRAYSRPYASRGSFAARRGDYTSVVDDEDELLGVDDAEIDDDDEL